MKLEMAGLLGFPNWAAYNLVPKMAAVPEAVFGFLDNLHSILKEKLTSEIDQLLEIKKQTVGDKFDGKINAWDYSYYQSIITIILKKEIKNKKKKRTKE